MSLAQASKEKNKVKFGAGDRPDEDNLALLPEPLCDLLDRSLKLQDRVRRLDATIHTAADEAPLGNPVERQLGLLKAAFEREGR